MATTSAMFCVRNAWRSVVASDLAAAGVCAPSSTTIPGPARDSLGASSTWKRTAKFAHSNPLRMAASSTIARPSCSRSHSSARTAAAALLRWCSPTCDDKPNRSSPLVPYRVEV